MGRLRDLHVKLEDSQYKVFRLAVKQLGYRTVSEYIREQVRAAIKRAESMEGRLVDERARRGNSMHDETEKVIKKLESR